MSDPAIDLPEAFLPCFKCGETLLNVFPDEGNQPSGGTEFRTYGHYGSTFWDSFDRTELILNVCDGCLRAHTDRLAVQGSPEKVVYAPIRQFGEPERGEAEADYGAAFDRMFGVGDWSGS